jgi:hypothetical protein
VSRKLRRTLSRVPCALALSLALAVGRPAAAQDLAAAGTAGSDRPPILAIDGSPAPVFPESITRDSLGRATVRAIRLSEPLVLDGRLDEAVYSEHAPFGGFVQVAPDVGALSSEPTDVWILYDDENMYVVCRCWDSAPPEEWVANELRRDTNGLRQNDHFGVMFDTFYDRRSGFMFYSNPLGARADYSVIDEGGSNTDWNPVWDVKTARFDGGWSIEMAIPFKSIRYRSGTDQVWGLQMRRSIRRLNEWSYLNPVPAFLAGPQALNRVSAGGTLVGLDLPEASRNLEIKPYAIAGLSTDRVADPAFSNDVDGDVGVDVKYGVTANLTADLTLNTDFAQVEVDEQQVNLTRFNLFFPEKREFFLEGRGMFDFGGGGGGMGPGGGGGNDAPSLFYSRRIGLDRGRVVPIRAGGRLTGKMGAYGLGLLNIQTGDEPAVGAEGANFTVVRLKRDILRRSSIGGIFTNRSVASFGEGSNQAYGVDAAFAFFTNLQINGYYARTASEGLDGDDASYEASVSYAGDRYGASAEYLSVGENFLPDVGFTRRRDFTKSSGSLRFSPRPASIDFIRRLTWQANLSYIENGLGELETRTQGGRFSAELESSDQFTLNVTRNYERLYEPFRVGTGVVIPTGGYGFTNARAQYQFGEQRRVSGSVSLQMGDFYDGTLTSVGVSGARAVVTNHLSVEPGITVNRIDLPVGEVNQTLLRSRADYAFTPRMFASALLQFNSNDRVFSSNLRFRWEYRPGSELFVVWTDERDTRADGPGLRNRALAVKITGLIRR